VRPEQKEKSLSELRSILKNITRDATKDTTDDTTAATTPKAGLKDALAIALKDQAATTSKRQSATPDVAKKVPNHPTQNSSPTEPTPPVRPAPAVTVSHQADDPLAVKKLERMMRTTGSDKPPIK
jgi:hypothetical protein